jgi:ribosome-binding factor A
VVLAHAPWGALAPVRGGAFGLPPGIGEEWYERQMTARTDRLDQLLRQEIGAILAKDVQDPRIGFVTVTDVETAPDLSTARVWVSVIGQPAERDLTVKALQHALPFVRHELGSRIRIRRIPELLLRVDDTLQRGTRVLQLLAELEAGDVVTDEPPAAESLPTPFPSIPIPPPPAARRRKGKAAAGRARGRGR